MFIGEFSNAKQDSLYWKYLTQYLSTRKEIGWGYWSFGSRDNYWEDTDAYQESVQQFGIVDATWNSLNHVWKVKDLQTVMDDQLFVNETLEIETGVNATNTTVPIDIEPPIQHGGGITEELR